MQTKPFDATDRNKRLRKYWWAGALTACISIPSFALNLDEEPLQPIEPISSIHWEKAQLGQRLFHETSISSDKKTSCASCHDLQAGGADNKAVSTGAMNTPGTRNSPTVFNAVFNFRQLWDGRAKTLAEQAHLAISNEMALTEQWDEAAKALAADSQYNEAFNALYGEVSKEAVTDAIAEFEKTLTTPDSPFDRYLKGDEQAITDQQKRGYSLFKSYGCSSCHQGQNVGGNMFQKFGVLKDITLRPSSNDDLGRYRVTGNEWDKYVFKVPSLRMVSLTPPYFHDGSVPTLEGAVDVMIEFQLGRPVPPKDRDDIVVFLKSLAGTYTNPLTTHTTAE